MSNSSPAALLLAALKLKITCDYYSIYLVPFIHPPALSHFSLFSLYYRHLGKLFPLQLTKIQGGKGALQVPLACLLCPLIRILWVKST